MVLEYKNTYIDLIINKTKDSTGIINDDTWCNVYIKVMNNEISYTNNRKSFSLKELNKTIKLLTESIQNNKNVKLTYIKNFFTIELLNYKSNKYLELILINIKHKDYEIIFKNDEIISFINLLSNIKD